MHPHPHSSSRAMLAWSHGVCPRAFGLMPRAFCLFAMSYQLCLPREIYSCNSEAYFTGEL